MNKQQLTFLIIDPSIEEFEDIKRGLQKSELWELEFIHCQSYQEGIQLINDGEVDFCFMEYYMESETGETLLEYVHQQEMHIPIILITAEKDIELEEKCIEQGAADYLVKSEMSPAILERSVKHCLARNEQLIQLDLEKQKYRNLFHHSLDAIFILNSKFEVIEYNNKFSELLGITNKQSFKVTNIFKNDSFENVLKSVENGAARNVSKQTIEDANGTSLKVYISISPLFGENFEKSYHCIIHDITELEEAQDRLVEKDKLNLISRVARIMGHEVRNPLTNILLAVEELEDEIGEKSGDLSILLGLIRRNSKRISELIDDFLKSARSNEFSIKENNLEEVIHSAIESCHDRILLKEITLNKNGLENQIPCSIDKERMEIALGNLLLNAVEAVEGEKNPEISISLEQNNDQALIIIRDNGVGMSQETKDNLFVPFYSSKQGGLGLGMTNVKNILSEHKATIKVDSAIGKGTQFHISIPIKV